VDTRYHSHRKAIVCPRRLSTSPAICNLSDVSAPRVFISYSHDSRNTRARIALADQLRGDGIDATGGSVSGTAGRRRAASLMTRSFARPIS